MFILGINQDRVDGDALTCGKGAPDCVGYEQLADALSSNALRAREPADQGGRKRLVAGQFAGEVRRKVRQAESISV